MASYLSETRAAFPVGSRASANLWDRDSKKFVLRSGTIREIKRNGEVVLDCENGSTWFFSCGLLNAPKMNA